MSAGDLVHVRFLKWPDRVHWRYDLRRLGEDEHGVWLYGGERTVIQRADEPSRHPQSAFLTLVPSEGWHVPIFNLEGPYEIYVDINTPPRWDGATVSMVDLDLDVVRYRNGPVAVIDEDEFADHRVRLGYPPEVVAAAERTATTLVAALVERVEPFGDAAGRWFDRVASST